MKFENLKQDKGVAGLTILLSLVTMLFIIGLLVTIFALMGGELKDADGMIKTSSGNTQNDATFADAGLTLTACSASSGGNATGYSFVMQNATNVSIVPATNYTVYGCVVTPSGAGIYNGTVVNITYTYGYQGNAYIVISNTTTGIANVTDWFDIFVVIGAMVVLIFANCYHHYCNSL